jgi:FMN reductase
MTSTSSAPDGPRWVALVGNPRTQSRTANLARELLDALVARFGATAAAGQEASRVVLDLAELSLTLGPPLGPDSQARYDRPLQVVAEADVLVVATPTYKGSYTGLLKAFLDHVPGGRLRGAVAIPVMTVGAPGHALAADVHLRPLLIELGASTPTGALVVGEDQLPDPQPAVATWVEANAAVLQTLLQRRG